MVIERDKNNILIKIDDSVDMKPIQKLIDHLNLMESVAKKQGTEEEAAALAAEIDKNGGRKINTVLLNDYYC